MPKTVKVGSRGPDVSELQKLLNSVLRLQPPLATDGACGTGTVAALVKFQKRVGLSGDGVCGARTWEKLKSAAPDLKKGKPCTVAPRAPDTRYGLPDTSELTEAEKYDFYLRYLDASRKVAKKAKDALAAEKRIILGLRVPTNTRASQGTGTYDDRFVVMWRAGKTRHAKEFVGTTDPTSRYEDGYKHSKKSYGEDVGGDKRKDLGRIPEGVYQYKKEAHGKYGDALRATSNIIPERDTNHDGDFDAKDIMEKARLKGNRSFLFHRGYNTMTGSAGCQTMNLPIYKKFWAALGTQDVFYYVLVEARPLPAKNDFIPFFDPFDLNPDLYQVKQDNTRVVSPYMPLDFRGQ